MTRPIRTLVLQKGQRAQYQGKIIVIEAIMDLNFAMVEDLASGEIKQVHISHLTMPPQEENASASSFEAVASPEAKNQAEYRRDVISPLLNRPGRTRADVAVRAAEYKLHPNTVYVWLRKFEECRELDALVRQQRSDKGTHKLPAETERFINLKFENLEPEERYPTAIHCAIKESIENDNAQRMAQTASTENMSRGPTESPPPVATPSVGTVRNRFNELPLKKVVIHRQGKQAAKQLFDPILEEYPGAEWPLAVSQIDHAKFDIMLVDPIERLPMGRPWFTGSIDVFSRAVPGYEYSLDPPGDMSTGLCIANSILPKEQWLADRGCTGEWLIWGKPATIHGDNAFRTNMLKQACSDHGMNLEWRPVKQARYGGHIERLCGSLASSIHLLPGTTFSNVDERGEYDSEAKAIFTPDEFEKWLLERILSYNAGPHSALGMSSPIERYRQGVFDGTANHPPTGLQPRIVDPLEQRRLRLDLMPFTLRSVQRYGVEIDKIFYYSDVLRRWINAPDPDHPKLKRLFMFRLFRRDISSIWFFDPELKEYFEIPTRDSTFPAMSIWDLHAIRRHAKSEGIPAPNIDEDYIKQRHLHMREIEDTANAKTKAARKERTRRERWASAPRPRVPNADPVEQKIDIEELYERVGEFDEDE